MASLPPRPKSPLPLLNARERVASAQPMSSRQRDDRLPPSRSRDTYIPSYGQGRHDDRDRDRFRDHDRRDRYRRDWSPPPRRRDSPDRDRRPLHRGPPRRYPSPRRGSYYHSRSRSPPRRGSPSPRRYRSHTRSRSRSPRRSPRSLRLGQYSVTNSPRSHSPIKRRSSKSRSPTPPKASAERSGAQELESKAAVLNAAIPPLQTEQPPTQIQTSESPIIEQEDVSHSPKIPRTQDITIAHLERPPTDTVVVKVESPKIKSEEVRVPQAVEDEVKSEPTSQADIRVPGMDNTDSPIPPRAPKSPPRTSMDDFSNRSSGPSVHRPRSPPRGPRAYTGHPRGSNTHPRSSARNVQPRRPQFQGSFKPKRIYIGDVEYLEVPFKGQNPILQEIDKSVAGTRRTASRLATEILQQSKRLSRQMHEFQLATMDLRAAESRRKMSDIHLEKARNGALGIDYSEESTETKA